jgi:hypothetical protein
MKEYSIEDCPAGNYFNIFGLKTKKFCCYKYHKYCDKVAQCKFKEVIAEITAEIKYQKWARDTWLNKW